MDYFSEVKDAADAVARKVREVPQIAVILGSGLSDFAARLADAVSMPYRDLPHWPASAVIGHEGRLVVGTVNHRTVAVLSGRSHAYEGHSMQAVTFPVQALGLLGVKSVI